MTKMEMATQKIFLGGDHAALDFKKGLLEYLVNELNYPKQSIEDCGAYDSNSVDYPDYAKKVCNKVQENENHFGVLICGTGIGINIAANKYKGIRAALVQSEFETEMSRQHNDANVVCFGARVINQDLAKKLLKIFLKTDFEGGRHQKRVEKIHALGDCQ